MAPNWSCRSYYPTFLNFSQKGKVNFQNILEFSRSESGFRDSTSIGSLVFSKLKIILFFLNMKQWNNPKVSLLLCSLVLYTALYSEDHDF